VESQGQEGGLAPALFFSKTIQGASEYNLRLVLLPGEAIANGLSRSEPVTILTRDEKRLDHIRGYIISSRVI
jgi:hypothetical protein